MSKVYILVFLKRFVKVGKAIVGLSLKKFNPVYKFAKGAML